MNEESRFPAEIGEQRDSGIALGDILPVLRHNLHFIGVIVALCLVVAIVWMRISGPAYIARMVVGPAEGLPQTSGMGAGALLGGLGGSVGGLSSLLGGSARTPLYERFEELLSSQQVASRLQAKHHVMQHLFRTRWNARTGSWTRPSGLLASISAGVHDFFGTPEWLPPDSAELALAIQKKLVISDTKDTGLRQVEFEDEDRAFAMDMLGWLYQEADATIRENDIVRTRAQIAYLRNELEQVMGVEHRTALTNLLEAQEQRQMLLLSNAPYGASVIVPPEAPTKPNSPKIGMTLALAIIVGFLLSSLFLLWKGAERKSLLVAQGYSPDEIRQALHAPLMEVSPRKAVDAAAGFVRHFTDR